jgi:hypothetical protein
MRLVIQQGSFKADVAPTAAQKVSEEIVPISQNNPLNSASVYFPGTLRGPLAHFGEFIGFTQMNTYADPTTPLEILVTRADTSGGSADYADVSLSGYLVPLP